METGQARGLSAKWAGVFIFGAAVGVYFAASAMIEGIGLLRWPGSDWGRQATIGGFGLSILTALGLFYRFPAIQDRADEVLKRLGIDEQQRR